MSKPRTRPISPNPARREPLRRQRPARMPRFEALEARELLATLIVNTNTDGNNPTAATLSLREAIELSNNDGSLLLSALSATARGLVSGSFISGVPNTIDFALTAPALTISVTSTPLPVITAPVNINGYSQSGSSVSASTKTQVDANIAVVQIDGSLLPSGSSYDGLAIASANCQVDGLIITGFSGAGLSISGLGSQGNWIWGNFLGALPDAINARDFSPTAAQPHPGNYGEGLRITSSNNRIGGNTPGLPNVIANNGYDASGNANPATAAGVGVLLDTTGGTGNLLQGNVIVNNANQGVFIRSSNNTIGEALTGGGNVISDNGGAGIEITGGSTVQGNAVVGNFIGTDLGSSDGTIVIGQIPFPNVGQGILILNSPRNIIGGSNVLARNVIGENDSDGVAINGTASVGNRVLNNYIGFNLVNSLIVFLPNQNGVSITAPGNVIGDPTGAAPNTISDNYQNGILISGAAASGNTIAANIIGLNPDGGSAFPNAFDGVHIDNAPNNLIGGTTAAARNTISANNNGVVITDSLYGTPGNVDTATGNVVEGNLIGTANDGTSDLGNAVDGVILNNAPQNTIGGNVSGAGNVISGNNRGVVITGLGSTLDQVQGNFIGTDLTGLVEITNKIDGVEITGSASGNTIGGAVSGSGNTIAYNVGAGVNVDSGHDNSLLGNSIFSNILAGIILNGGNNANNGQIPPVLTIATPNASSTYIQGTLTGASNTTYTLQFFSNPTQPFVGFEQGQVPLYTAQVTTNSSGVALIAQRIPQAVANNQWITATATDPAGDTSTFSAAVQTIPVGVQFSATGYSASESSGSATITVTRTGDLGGIDTVDYSIGGGSAVSGTDYSPVSGTLVFNPGVSSQPFSIPILDTQKVGGSLTVNLSLSNATNNATLGTPSTAALTILDDDSAAVKLNASLLSVNENAGSIKFTVSRNSPIGTATVNYKTANGTAKAGVNYTSAMGTLTFAPGQTTQTVNVPILDDGVVTGPLQFTLALTNPVNCVLGAPATTTVTVNNTDTPGGTQTPVSLTITVNTTADENDPTDGTISLREAIELSNGTLPLSALSFTERNLVQVFPVLSPTGSAPPVPKTIDIALPGSGIQTIELSSALPAITAPVSINGYTQPGSAVSSSFDTGADVNAALVQVDGSLLPTPPSGQTLDGLAIQTSNCVVNGLIITGFHDAGISISGLGSQGNWLWGNFFGAFPDPTTGKAFEINPLTNAQLSRPQIGNLGEGVRITSSNNRIGGDTPGLPNVMANNGYDNSGNPAGGVGILIATPGGTGNLIQGNNIFNNAEQGILVESSNNTIGEAQTGGGNVIGDNGAQGIEITGGPNVQGNQVLGNLIGTNLGDPLNIPTAKGTIPFPNKAQGILIENSPKNTIGGYNSGALNVIGSNLLDGIEIDGASSTGNRILNNDIGFNVSGTTISLLPNQNGISITAPGNFVGDATGNGGNTISNNRNQGILLFGAGASGNTIAGNRIGINPGGASAFPNAFDGVHIDNAPNNIIGGLTAQARNTISANNNGVYITGAGATGNVVEGNFLGTAADGVTDLGNAVDGVVLDNAPLNTIGGTATGAGNVISGNNRGVVITGLGSMNELVQGNFIGTDLTAKYVLANKIDGVLVTAGASNNSIGGLSTGAGNTIAYNAGEGVYLDSGTGNAVLNDGIAANNASGGIFLNPIGNANHLQAAPVLTAVLPDNPSTSVQGTLSALANTTYTVQIFASNAKDPSGFGQGQTPVYTTTVTTDATGNAVFNITGVTGIVSGQWVTATATDPTGNTSAFSNSMIAVPVALQLGASSYTVNESAGAVAITVTRTGGQGGSVSVNFAVNGGTVGSSRVDLQACKLEYSIVSPK